MNNSLQTIINVLLGVAVAVLFFLHFSPRPAAKAAPAKAVVSTTAKPDSAEATPVEEPAPAAEEADATPVAETPAAPAPADKIAYVESGKLLDGYVGMKDARRAFETKAKGWERQNQTLVTNFRAAVEAYQKQGASMTAEQRAATEQKLQAQQQQAGAQQEQLQRQAQAEEAKLTETVLGRINKQIEAYGKSHGYKLILIAAPSGTIAYGQKDLDITAPVLAYLNSEYKKK